MGLRPKVGDKVVFCIYHRFDKNPLGECIDRYGHGKSEWRRYEGEIVDLDWEPNFEHTKMKRCWLVKRCEDSFMYKVTDKDSFEKYLNS